MKTISLGRLALLSLFLSCCSISFSQENCANGIDDDGDGFIDLNDVSDCVCKSSPPLLANIANPSFEEMNACPTMGGQIDFATHWHNASMGTTTDYYNVCGFQAGGGISIPQPLPDGVGCAGIVFDQNTWYHESLSSCLQIPFSAGTTYALTLSVASPGNGCDPNQPLPSLDLFLYGNAKCPSAFGTTSNSIFNPIAGAWQKLDSISITPNNKWHEITFTFTPSVDLEAFAFGSFPWDNVSYFCASYLMIDHLKLTEVNGKSEMTIDSTGDLCNQNLVLTAHPAYVNGSYQWYKDGIALIGQTSTTLHITTEGAYTFRNVESLSSLNCVSKTTNIHSCSSFKIKMPNVFTPNEDGANDVFLPLNYYESDFQQGLSKLKNIDFAVYDRWGLKMCEVKNKVPSWNGKFLGNEAPSGTYYFTLNYQDANGKIMQLSGSITLIR